MSLYLKYRPQNFGTVVGQGAIVTTLKNAVRRKAMTHAYLFCGSRGTGKTSLARIVAKSLNCLEPAEAEPCGKCRNCEAITQGRLVDLIEIDAASNRGIDEIRELREKILFAPTHGNVKVYIIDEVHMLTKEAFNALLKTLEEPPDHAYFILATTEAHKIPETIVSRCQQFNFRRIDSGAIVKRLEEIAGHEGVQADPEALTLIARLSDGGLRDAIGLFEQMIADGTIRYDEAVARLGVSGHLLIDSFGSALDGGDIEKALALIDEAVGQGLDMARFCEDVIAHLREKMLIGVGGQKDVGAVLRNIDLFMEAKTRIGHALVPQLPLEIAAIKACGFEANVSFPPIVKEEIIPREELSTKQPIQSEAGAPVDQKTDISAPPDSPPADALPLTLEQIKGHWPRILENIATPFIRMSFADSEPTKIENGSLHLTFRSGTLMEKAMSVKGKGEILGAAETILKAKITIKYELKKIDLQPVADPQTASAEHMAREVFGV